MSRRTIALLVAWITAAACAGVALFLLQPTGPVKWALWLVAAPPVYTVVSGAVELIVQTYFAAPGTRQATNYFEKRAEGRLVSAPRMLWYMFAYTLLFVVAVAIFASVYKYVSDFIEQDRCLDAGGRWNEERHACEGAER